MAGPTPDIESPITKDWQHGGIKIRKWRVSGERCALLLEWDHRDNGSGYASETRESGV